MKAVREIRNMTGPENMLQERKIRFLRNPEAYPGKVRTITVKETHMSWVFLAGRYVYKLKKPVYNTLMDFRTPETRYLDAIDEIRLNRPLAPGVYLDIAALTINDNGLLALNGTGEPIDWLVRMKRLPEQGNLEHKIHQDTLIQADIDRIGHYLARFYRRTRQIKISAREYIRRFQEDIRENRAELSHRAYDLPCSLVESITDKQNDFISRKGALLAHRAVEGKIVEGHGDLRPEHIYCLDPAPAIIDCLSFNLKPRTLDPVDDLGFLHLECRRLGREDIGRNIFAIYRQVTGDRFEENLADFYKSFRAAFRARLTILHLREGKIGNPERGPEKWIAKSSRYLEIADDYARRL